jgi:putative DNA primase/helicase
LLVVELLGEFPWDGPGEGKSELAHALALMLLPFVRAMIPDPAPLHLIEAPAPGTGKSLLAEVLAVPMLGKRPLPSMAEGRDSDEWRKRITAKLRTAPSFFLIDNVRHKLDSGALAQMITTGMVEDRILQTSILAQLPVRCALIATANNPALSDEMIRRTVRIRLDTKLERPEEREGFRHPNLKAWARKNQGELIWAALTLARAWVADGQPPGPDESFGSFECWTAVMGGILAHAGVPGLLGNRGQLRRENEDTSVCDFLGAVFRAFGTGEFSSADIADIAATSFGIDGPQSIGARLRELRDRPITGLILRSSGRTGGVTRWRIEDVRRRNSSTSPISPTSPGQQSIAQFRSRR